MKRPLKRALIGFEVEFFTINNKGYIVNAADQLLKRARDEKKDITIKKECASNLIEVISYPNERVADTMDHLLEEIEYLITIAEKENVMLLPAGCYPGTFSPGMRTDKNYKIQESILGKNRFAIAGRCAGFHCHYSLPKGIFDEQVRMIKMLVRSKIKDSVVNSYNFLIAADPALTTFMQSSPYYQGNYIGKDSRVIMYRGGMSLDNPQGLYADFGEFGGLPPYRLTALDILNIITTRYEKWKALLKSVGVNIQTISQYGSMMDTTWNPVKINPNGTLEQRGMDMNHPLYIAGIGITLKNILRKLQQEYYAVVPSDIGIKEPFKLEGDTVYIPPYSHVKNTLQKLAAYRGMEEPVVHDYCKRFLRFAESVMEKDRRKITEPFRKMIESKTTVSDNILAEARKMGYSKKEKLPPKAAGELALAQASKLYKEIIMTRSTLRNL